MRRVDHYRTLGVAPSAGRDEIRRAYLDLARRLHPDRVGDDDPAHAAATSARMAAINDAWRVLGDDDERAAYDRRRPEAPRVPRPQPPPPSMPRHDAWPADPDEPAPDTIEGTPVQLALRVLPWVVIGLVIVALFVFTAYAGPTDEAPSRPLVVGSCVLTGDADGDGADDLSVVDCARVNDGRVVEILPAGRECSDPDTFTLARPGPPGVLCLETTLNTRTQRDPGS